jgi:hypothetical protein
MLVSGVMVGWVDRNEDGVFGAIEQGEEEDIQMRFWKVTSRILRGVESVGGSERVLFLRPCGRGLDWSEIGSVECWFVPWNSN